MLFTSVAVEGKEGGRGNLIFVTRRGCFESWILVGAAGAGQIPPHHTQFIIVLCIQFKIHLLRANEDLMAVDKEGVQCSGSAVCWVRMTSPSQATQHPLAQRRLGCYRAESLLL